VPDISHWIAEIELQLPKKRVREHFLLLFALLTEVDKTEDSNEQ